MAKAKALQTWEDAVKRAALQYTRTSTVAELKWASEREHVKAVIARSRELKAAMPQTIMQAILQGASMGLSFNPILGHCYMIPRKSRRKRDDESWDQYKNASDAFVIAYASPSYKGLSKICIEAAGGSIIQIRAEVVFKADKFRYFGPIEKPQHEPVLTQTHRTQALVQGAYAIVEYSNGSFSCEYVDLATLEAIRAMSETPGSVMYGKLFSEGYKKIAIRRMTKTVQVSSIRLESATAILNQNEGITIDGEAKRIEHEDDAETAQVIENISFEDGATLKELCEEAGLAEDKLKEAYGIENIDDLPASLLEAAKARIASYKDRRTTP